MNYDTFELAFRKHDSLVLWQEKIHDLANLMTDADIDRLLARLKHCVMPVEIDPHPKSHNLQLFESINIYVACMVKRGYDNIFGLFNLDQYYDLVENIPFIQALLG